MLSRFLLALCIAVLAGCERQPETQAQANSSALPAASVERVRRGPIASHLKAAGQFIPYQGVDLHAKVSGYIRKINVDIGDQVHANQVIAVLEVPELDAQAAGAKAEVRHNESEIERAESGISRAKSMHAAIHSAYERLRQASEQRPGLVAQQELDDAMAKDRDAEAEIDVAKASAEAARQQLGVSQANDLRVRTLSNYSIVTAPFNGVITARYADLGSLIQAGTASNTQSMPIVRVAQSDLLRLRIPVPESDVPYIHTGGSVLVNVRALKRSWTGDIVRFARSLDMGTRTMLIEVDLPNPNLTLTPGMFAETDIVLQHADNALSIPAAALIRNSDTSYVLAVTPEDVVERRPVSTGIEGDNRVEIRSGLSAGDSVIVSGQDNYQVGEHVRPQAAASGLAP